MEWPNWLLVLLIVLVKLFCTFDSSIEEYLVQATQQLVGKSCAMTECLCNVYALPRACACLRNYANRICLGNLDLFLREELVDVRSGHISLLLGRRNLVDAPFLRYEIQDRVGLIFGGLLPVR